MGCCNGCTKRTVTCHSTCRDYKIEVAENQKKKAATRSIYYTSSPHLRWNKSGGRYVLRSHNQNKKGGK